MFTLDDLAGPPAAVVAVVVAANNAAVAFAITATSPNATNVVYAAFTAVYATGHARVTGTERVPIIDGHA